MSRNPDTNPNTGTVHGRTGQFPLELQPSPRRCDALEGPGGKVHRCSTQTVQMMLGAMVVLAGLSAAPATATPSMQHTYRTGIDVGNDPATGCDFSLGSVAPNVLPGFELQVTVVVDAGWMPPQVVSAQIETCSGDGGSFGNPQPLPGSGLEIDGGMLGSDSIVGAIPRSLLGNAGIVRLAHHALSENGSEDALFTLDGTPDGPAITAQLLWPVQAPLLSGLGIALAVLLLLGVGLTQWRRGHWAAAQVLVFVASGAVIAYAAFGGPVAVDHPTDANPRDTRAEIVASFLMATNNALRLRLDIKDIDATCSDGVHNQDETDVDCGGSTCARCPAGSICGSGSDCISAVCTGAICQDPCGGKVDGAECDAGMIQLDDCQTTRCDAGACLVALRPEGALCRAGSGDECDLDEVCDGESPSCPPDVYEDDTHVCRTGSGDACDPDETCPGQAGVPCPPDHVEAEDHVCRPGSGDVCDPDETCTGVAGDACPSDEYSPAGFVCNAGSGDICDPDETCSGVPGQSCPNDQFATSATACHQDSAFQGFCRENATCLGVPDQPCPVTYKSADTVCRAGSSDGICNPPEYCTGSSAACPALDVRSPETTRVFITLGRYTGDLVSEASNPEKFDPPYTGNDGLEAADYICNAEASRSLIALQSPGETNFVAWLSTRDIDAKDRLTPGSCNFYSRANLIADDIPDLLDGSLQSRICVNFLCLPTTTAYVWTGTKPDGTSVEQNDILDNCLQWTDTAFRGATMGYMPVTSYHWTFADPPYGLSGAIMFCDAELALYCFEK